MSKILVIGDSIAKGLASYLSNNTNHAITDAAVEGETIKSCTARCNRYSNYDIVIVATSTNDYSSTSIYSSYDTLISKILSSNSRALCYTLSSPGVVSKVTSYTHVDNANIIKHNTEIQNVSRSAGVNYINVYNILGDQNSSNLQYRQSDGLHLNSTGYAQIYNRLSRINEGNTVNINAWVWPVPGYGEEYITSKFGYRKQPTAGASTNHKGIDIGAPLGTAIVATHSGKVTHSGKASGYGNAIYIDHGNGIISIYGHMKTLLVSTGATVNTGDTIALVGSEGYSTGPHLHFQIEVNGTPVDPLTYVSPDSATMINPNALSTGNTLDLSNMYTIDASGVTVGQRVSGLTPQPLHAFVNIYIGEDLLLLSTKPPKPNTLQLFEYNRLQDAGETASFTVFDDNWEDIELVLSNNFDRIYIEYGYPGTGLKSKLIKHRLLEYNVSFVSTGTIISISSVTGGSYENLKPRSIVLNTFNPTEAVKKICREMKFIVRDENFDSSQDINAANPFNVLETYPITYIQNTIVPQAAQENEELFTFYVDSDNVAYFKRESYDSSLTDNMRTYIYQKGYDSNVIDLSFNLKGVFGGSGDFAIATGYRGTVFDTKSKDQGSYEADKSSVVTIATGDVVHTKSDQSNPVVDSSGYSLEQMKNQIYYNMKAMRYDAYEANMTIVGDPTLSLHEMIRIINITDKGNLHHTSGVYRINDITDTIQNGAMTTALKLYRNATYDIDGVEIINPKLMVK